MTTIDIPSVGETVEWATPWPFYHYLDEEFRFKLDAAAKPWNAKCRRFFSGGAADDGLVLPWAPGPVFCNPPYGRDLGKWVEKAIGTGRSEVVVMLLAARVDTVWFHDLVMPHAKEIRFLRGRLKFERNKVGESGTPQFPSMVVVFGPGDAPLRVSSLDWRKRGSKSEY